MNVLDNQDLTVLIDLVGTELERERMATKDGWDRPSTRVMSLADLEVRLQRMKEDG